MASDVDKAIREGVCLGLSQMVMMTSMGTDFVVPQQVMQDEYWLGMQCDDNCAVRHEAGQRCLTALKTRSGAG